MLPQGIIVLLPVCMVTVRRRIQATQGMGRMRRRRITRTVIPITSVLVITILIAITIHQSLTRAGDAVVIDDSRLDWPSDIWPDLDRLCIHKVLTRDRLGIRAITSTKRVTQS